MRAAEPGAGRIDKWTVGPEEQTRPWARWTGRAGLHRGDASVFEIYATADAVIHKEI
jgi:hypothetical protein